MSRSNIFYILSILLIMLLVAIPYTMYVVSPRGAFYRAYPSEVALLSGSAEHVSYLEGRCDHQYAELNGATISVLWAGSVSPGLIRMRARSFQSITYTVLNGTSRICSGTVSDGGSSPGWYELSAPAKFDRIILSSGSAMIDCVVVVFS